MVVYGGVLDDNHLRAVVRVGLRAHGFKLPQTDYQYTIEEQWRLGCWLRDDALPKRFPAFVVNESYRRLKESDQYLWNRLPVMAGLGFRQATVLHGLAPVSSSVDAEVALLGAAFNMAIAVLDYIVDEISHGNLIFNLLNRDLVNRIFEPDGQVQNPLALAYEQTSNPTLRLLLTLVGTCASEGLKLACLSGNNEAWENLGETIKSLFEAEKTVSSGNHFAQEETRMLLPFLKTKSVSPSLAMLQISALASNKSAIPDALAWRMGKILGQTFLQIDDLVDLISDCRRGTPSALVVRLDQILSERKRSWASDGDIYDLVDIESKNLVEMLATDNFKTNGLKSQDFAASHSDVGSSVPVAALAEVHKFACTTVASWVGWDEDQRDVQRASGCQKLTTAGSSNGSAVKALDFLLVQQRDGFREAIHHLNFPRADWSYEKHPALLSFRSVALDGLLDAYAAGLPVPRNVLDAEGMWILREKHRDVRGGWNYVQEVAELPPDVDDLGQVLQVLSRLGGPGLAFSCEEGIRLALDAAEPDGGINTWILDPRCRSAADKKIRAYLQVMGGWGVHSEVMANLLYGLILYDPVRYQEAMLPAVRYLESVQNELGAWTSKWYTGPYYGTYRVVSVLSFLNPGSPSLDRARKFLLDTQNSADTWGEDANDSLSTALALLSLIELGMRPDDIVIKRGVAYLIQNQSSDGSWPACPWIHFPTMDGIVRYKSMTITTTFCLKALLRAVPSNNTSGVNSVDH